MSQIPAIHNALPRSLVEYKRNELSTYFHTSIHSSIYPSQQFSKLLDKRNQSKMSFNASAQNIRIEGNNLVATVSNDAGHQADASLDLNAIIGNDDGASPPTLQPLIVADFSQADSPGAEQVRLTRFSLRNMTGGGDNNRRLMVV